jgi:hypothetical protein
MFCLSCFAFRLHCKVNAFFGIYKEKRVNLSTYPQFFYKSSKILISVTPQMKADTDDPSAHNTIQPILTPSTPFSFTFVAVLTISQSRYIQTMKYTQHIMIAKTILLYLIFCEDYQWF